MKGAAVTYHRVSTTDQRPELAREELKRAVEARGLALVDAVEESCSGAKTVRPGLTRVLDLVRRHQVDHVLVWKLDRFGRTTIDILLNVRTCQEHGVRFISFTQGINIGPGSTASDQLQLVVLAGMAEYEMTLIGERTLLGLAGARRRGKPLGRPKGSKDSKPRRQPRRWGTT
jgi:putative DNA-invertase from lambdoid prophage Rac